MEQVAEVSIPHRPDALWKARLCRKFILLCQGHLLIEDVPGVGKTMLARSLARSLGCSFSRIQFAPDDVPNDLTQVTQVNLTRYRQRLEKA